MIPCFTSWSGDFLFDGYLIFHIFSFVNALFLVNSYLIRKLCEKKKLNFFCTLLLYIKNNLLYLHNENNNNN